MTLLLFVFQSSLQSPFKSFLKNNDKSLSPKKEKSSRRLSALVGVFLKSCGNFGVRAVEGELFHLFEVTGEFFVVLGIFLSQYLSQSWGINIPVVKKKLVNNLSQQQKHDLQGKLKVHCMETGCKISKALKKQKKANAYETMIMPITYITMFYDIAGFWF